MGDAVSKSTSAAQEENEGGSDEYESDGEKRHHVVDVRDDRRQAERGKDEGDDEDAAAAAAAEKERRRRKQVKEEREAEERKEQSRRQRERELADDEDEEEKDASGMGRIQPSSSALFEEDDDDFGDDDSVAELEDVDRDIARLNRGNQDDRLYPAELEQSEEFTNLLSGGQPRQRTFDFITTNAVEMDKYVRHTMYTLLRFLAQCRPGARQGGADGYMLGGDAGGGDGGGAGGGLGDADDGLDKGGKRRAVGGRYLTMRDLTLYTKFFAPEFQQQYALRLERFLNSNGLSLQMDSTNKFDPRELAKLFVPVYTPTRVAY